MRKLLKGEQWSLIKLIAQNRLFSKVLEFYAMKLFISKILKLDDFIDWVRDHFNGALHKSRNWVTNNQGAKDTLDALYCMFLSFFYVYLKNSIYFCSPTDWWFIPHYTQSALFFGFYASSGSLVGYWVAIWSSSWLLCGQIFCRDDDNFLMRCNLLPSGRGVDRYLYRCNRR